MPLTTAQKEHVIQSYQQSKQDTGSPEVQVALLTTRINMLTEHLKIHKNDLHTRYGLTNMVSKRYRLLRYLKRNNTERYLKLIKALEIRG